MYTYEQGPVSFNCNSTFFVHKILVKRNNRVYFWQLKKFWFFCCFIRLKQKKEKNFTFQYDDHIVIILKSGKLLKI